MSLKFLKFQSIILLLYHANINDDIVFRSGSSKVKKIWRIAETKTRLGPVVCNEIIFIHAFFGCDTTSQPFNVSKFMPLKQFEEGSFSGIAKTFMNPESDHKAVAEAGQTAFVKIYKGKHDDTLRTLRPIKYKQKLLKKGRRNVVQAKELPPTYAAAKYHAYRVFFQVQEWRSLGKNYFDPCQWGWHLQGDSLAPHMTNLAAAPDELIMIIRCTCKKNCGTGKCTCKKHGLPCTGACAECRGTSCSNLVALDEAD